RNVTGVQTCALPILDVLAQFNGGRRIIITPGMIELGNIQEETNQAVGEQIGRAQLDLVILVGEDQTEPIVKGIRSTAYVMDKVHFVQILSEANELMQSYAEAGDIVLYENDLPDSYDE